MVVIVLRDTERVAKAVLVTVRVAVGCHGMSRKCRGSKRVSAGQRLSRHTVTHRDTPPDPTRHHRRGSIAPGGVAIHVVTDNNRPQTRSLARASRARLAWLIRGRGSATSEDLTPLMGVPPC